ncbi:MAG: hypothetical protein WDN31_03855 [Hyphomicrobium sp.]
MSLEFIVETPRGIWSMGISLPASGAVRTSPPIEPAAGAFVTTGGASGAGAAATGAGFFFGTDFFCAVETGAAFFWMTSTGGNSFEGAGAGAAPAPVCWAIVVLEIVIAPAQKQARQDGPGTHYLLPVRAG